MIFNSIFSYVKELKYIPLLLDLLAKNFLTLRCRKILCISDVFLLSSLLFQIIQLDCLYQLGKQSRNTYLREGNHLVSLQLAACWQILGCTNLQHDEVGNNGRSWRI